MDQDLTRLLDDLAGLRVVVLGDVVLDCYLEGSSDRLCREAPVPNVTVSGRHDVPGAAGNTAVNVAALGGRAAFLGVVGDDPEGFAVRRALEGAGVVCDSLLTQPRRRTVAKHRVLAGACVVARFDQGDTDDIAPGIETQLLARLDDEFPGADAVIVSDYGSGVLTPRVIERLAAWQARRPRVIVADSRKRLAAFRAVGVTAIKPNADEALALLGDDPGASRADHIAQYGERLLELTGARLAAVTLDCDGGLLFERGQPPYRTYAPPTPQPHVAGAGDTYVAALTLALTAGANPRAAVELAAVAASVVVTKDGTAICTDDELRDRLTTDGKLVCGLDRLAERAAALHQQGKRIVFTNGCFDLLHRGHVALLRHAKSFGDVLIVGVNSDASVRRVKGVGRPVNPLEDRLQVLAELGCVDVLAVFDGDTSEELVRAVRPTVFVKGGTYAATRIPEAALVEELGGVVRVLDQEQGYSTSRLIERIRDTGRRPNREGELVG
jgi:D-beta-D-heptose 7-phosphate kinase/D-beta-D-heptose 1-phosphate adenosyltransferase